MTETFVEISSQEKCPLVSYTAEREYKDGVQLRNRDDSTYTLGKNN